MAIDAKGLVLMNMENGILVSELGSYEILSGLEFVYKAYVSDNTVKLFVTTDRDVTDEQYNEVFDEYETDELEKEEFTVEEVDDEYNPVWCISLPYKEEYDEMNDDLNYILAYHKKEIERIFNKITAD
jgi:hypothetical protein